ncbi:MAG: PEP-CTERM sorting domain-containing protein [Bryobacteraceae bacterium]|nr:PEP-CTERM sorting domain-containing protein [Bryobacteraceae bacterium]
MVQKLLITLTLVCVFASGVMAGPIVSGDLALLSMPGSVLTGALTSDTTAYLLPEALKLTVTSGLSSLWGIATGTLVDVWLIHSDPVSSRGEYSGSVEFGKDILHVDTLASSISAADPLLASSTGTAYPTGDGWRGIGPKDSLTVSGARTADFSFITITGVDQARIITEAETPEPATLSLVGAGAVLLGLARRRARRKASSLSV